MTPRVCQWQGCIQRAEWSVWFDRTKRADIHGGFQALSPIVYCWDHFCQVDDLFLIEKVGSLKDSLLRSA